MLTQIDIDESTVESEGIVQEWEQEFQTLFHGAEMIAGSIMQLLEMSPEERAAARASDPSGFARAEAQIDKMRGYLYGP